MVFNIIIDSLLKWDDLLYVDFVVIYNEVYYMLGVLCALLTFKGFVKRFETVHARGQMATLEK